MSENGQEKRETLAVIADEIRRAVESMGDEMPYTVSAGTMRRVADRIGAAWKRQEKTYLDQIRDAVNMWGHEKYIAEHEQKPTVGNAAAMRDALTNLTRYVESDIRQLEQLAKRAIDNDIYGGGILQDLCEAIREGKSALSAPARNCDLKECSSVDGMISAHERFCESWHADGNYCSECPFNTESKQMTTCREMWLLAPAERKGDCDGSK